jgi:hypothetical protein
LQIPAPLKKYFHFFRHFPNFFGRSIFTVHVLKIDFQKGELTFIKIKQGL